MFNHGAFNEVQFGIIMELVEYIPPDIPLGKPNNKTLMFDTDVVPITYVGEQYSYANSPWTPHDGMLPYQWVHRRNLQLLFGSNDGYVYRFYDGYEDAGEKIESYYVTKSIDLGVPDRKKRLRWIDIDCDVIHGSVLQVYYRMDDDNEWTLLAEIDQGDGKYKFIRMPRRLCRKVAFKFANGYKACDFRINSFSIDMVVHGQHKEVSN